MAVLKSQRKTSTMEFLHNAYELRKYIVFKLLKDFELRIKYVTQRISSILKILMKRTKNT